MSSEKLFHKVVLTTEYLPPIRSYWAMTNAEFSIIETHENYQKKSNRNRAKILGVNGIEVLSIPLKSGKNKQMPIAKVEISYETKWQSQHLHSIRSAYGNSAYFDYYYPEIERLIRHRVEKLIDFNETLYQYFNKCLGLNLKSLASEEYLKKYPDNYLDLRSIGFSDTRPHSDYIPKKYEQVFMEHHGFISGLSILDLLMCKGPESILYI